MISSDIMRGYNDIIILCILRIKESYGYEIAKIIQQTSEGNYIMKETTLYSTFNRLEKNGYLTSYSGSETFGKQRTYYRITEAGRKYCEEKCAEWKLTKQVIDQFTEGGIQETP